MVRVKAGEVVVVPFPFSDLSQAKVRPALCLADAGNGDWVCCQITSQPYSDAEAIALASEHFLAGSLDRLSFVRPAKLFTAHQSLLYGSVGHLKIDALRSVLERVVALFTK